MRMSNTSQVKIFSSKEPAITRLARVRHAANLTSGGVFGSDEKPFSDYSTEKAVAANESCRWDGFRKLWIKGEIAYA